MKSERIQLDYKSLERNSGDTDESAAQIFERLTRDELYTLARAIGLDMSHYLGLPNTDGVIIDIIMTRLVVGNNPLHEKRADKSPFAYEIEKGARRAKE
jgi:hypothetical protein